MRSSLHRATTANPKLTRSEQDARYKTPKVVLPFGDSITYLDCGLLSEAPSSLRTPATAYLVDGAKGTGMYAWANWFLGHPFKFVGNAGVPGDTTAMMLARIDAMLAIPSDIVAVQGGANDWTDGVTNSRTGAQEAAITIANLTAIYARIVAAGKTLLVLTVHSRSTMNSADGKAYLSIVNRWILDYARATPGVLHADTCSVMTDSATGVPYNPLPAGAGFFPTADGTHPNNLGAMMLGQVIAKALTPLVRSVNVFSTNGNSDPFNFSRNASMTGTTGTVANGVTGTAATQVTVNTSSGTAVAAASKVARTDGLPGEWQRVVIGPANTAPMLISISILWDATGANGVKPGDKLLIAAEVRTTTLTGVSLFACGFRGSSGATAQDLIGAWSNGTGTIPDGTGVFLLEGFVVGVSETFASIRLSVTATSGTIDVGRTAVLKQ